jgi:pimeloyl-ACP methyl ester carboxylesterase
MQDSITSPTTGFNNTSLMNIKAKSYFKVEQRDHSAFNEWVSRLEMGNNREYNRITVKTSLGNTQVFGLNVHDESMETLVIFPGARTTSLIWDFDRGLDNLKYSFRIFMIETNGLPNLSDGSSPDIRSLDYGHWANEVLEKLKIKKTFIAGASFGGLICMKLGITNPEKINAAFIINPGCLQPFSLTFKNLYYNILPLINPGEKNIRKFLDNAVFSKPNHRLSEASENLLVEYQLLAIRNYKDNTQKPYYMGEQLATVKAPTYLLLGDKDILFPFGKSISNARKYLHPLKDVKVFENVGHGIETHDKALNYIGEKINQLSTAHVGA